MGNAHTKEARDGSRSGRYEAGTGSSAPGQLGAPGERSERRSSRREMSALELLTGGGSSSRNQQADAPFERRETKQEREARRLERERVARVKERERSMKEEHVDGGFLVTMGVYTASEDFSKPVVRQLQIERKIAPFWRGLDDFRDSWAEHQIIAAARGLDIPAADEVPEGLVPQHQPSESPSTSLPNLNNLTVPMGPRTLSATSDKTASNPGSSLPSPTATAPPRVSSPLKPHKALAAALSMSSRNASQQDIVPREINLPNDPFVNGQPLEVFLYKDGVECPICCMYYPRYLNKTRCCDQFICSECFVQIKRPDPHLPEHHGDQQDGAENPPSPNEQTGELIMEPACCPYCTQTEFGVTYDAPPFRRGLAYAFNPPALGSMSTAMSSSSSLSSSLSPTSATIPAFNSNRRRAQSLSASDPGVITTDRIRPDWVTKLNAARAQQRRRAAAADALHHAAYVMGQNESSRSLFGRSGRFSRRQTGIPGTESPGSSSNVGAGAQGSDTPLTSEAGPRNSTARTGPTRERIDAAHLESMMMAEAIRLSLADEEERRKKADKEAKKEAKKKEKEERKANKRKSNIYGPSESGSSASASTLSLGLGRKRGNSAAGSQSLRVEASVAAANANNPQSSSAPVSPGPAPEGGQDKGKAVDRGDNSTLPIPISQVRRGSSHLRQMSNASSISSSGLDSLPGSYSNRHLGPEDPRASGLSLGGGKSDDEGTGTEPLFNYHSLAQMVGVPIGGQPTSTNGTTEDQGSPAKDGDSDKALEEHHEHIERAETARSDATATGLATSASPTAADRAETGPDNHDAPGEVESGISEKPLKLDTDNVDAPSETLESGTQAEPPSLMITPETPAPLSDGEEDSKQLGRANQVERPGAVIQ